MKKTTFLCMIMLVSGLTTIHAQTPNCPTDAKEVSYDIILVAGQSNTHYGYPLDAALDTVNSRVYSLHRQNGLDYRIAPAKPALDFWTKQTNRNSFSITFSNLYIQDVLKDSQRRVLIIPCGYAGSSITSWTKNQNLYVDAINRVNYVLENIPGSKLVAVLWHQGEANVGWAPYQTTLDTMIADMRNDIKQENTDEVPFILGGMVPYWVNSNSSRKQQQQIIKDTPNRVSHTGYADSELPTAITKPNNSFDDIHFDATGQREMGYRYYDTFLKMISNSDMINTSQNQLTETILSEAANQSQVIIHPNPTSDQITLSSPVTMKQVEIYNQGQKSVFKNQYDHTLVTIPTQNLEKGLYFVIVTLENNRVERIKILKK
ncbi:sialate O-acetylesterase [Flavobacterium sp. HSC-61S13]|uniref:sialate O-acetylesterase n=1 Tax=Flavobacterium sp. HSC-61S13 TaxID=2910963 RepID=UPI00209C931F|nr:sialate O-acetylesterase [Flavobacterium sp. HSC-61S13]MCP1996460.1 hypothetical protein [Flavobacterium sp. HSC-61S13]